MTRNPKREKIASTCSRRIVSGCRWPIAGRLPGSVTSTAPFGRLLRSACSRAAVEPRLDLLFELIRELAKSRPFLGGRRAERLQERRHEPALPRQVPIADDAQLGLGRCSGDFPFELGAEIFDLAGGIAHELRAVVNVASATFTTAAG